MKIVVLFVVIGLGQLISNIETCPVLEAIDSTDKISLKFEENTTETVTMKSELEDNMETVPEKNMTKRQLLNKTESAEDVLKKVTTNLEWLLENQEFEDGNETATTFRSVNATENDREKRNDSEASNGTSSSEDISGPNITNLEYDDYNQTALPLIDEQAIKQTVKRFIGKFLLAGTDCDDVKTSSAIPQESIESCPVVEANDSTDKISLKFEENTTETVTIKSELEDNMETVPQKNITKRQLLNKTESAEDVLNEVTTNLEWLSENQEFEEGNETATTFRSVNATGDDREKRNDSEALNGTATYEDISKPNVTNLEYDDYNQTALPLIDEQAIKQTVKRPIGKFLLAVTDYDDVITSSAMP